MKYGTIRVICELGQQSSAQFSANLFHLDVVMNSSELDPKSGEVVEVAWSKRWQVYRRLQELGISCWCQVDHPLRVKITNTTEAVQLASVLRRLSASPRELALSLERAWHRS